MTFQSVTFGTDNRTVVSNDHDHLNRGVQNPNAMSDSDKASINIATKVGGLFTYNTGSDAPATHRDNVTKVQLRAPDGKVQIGAYRTDEATVENLKAMAPEMFVPEAEKLAEAAKAETEAQQAEAERADLNTHPVPEIEAAHMHLNDMVSMQDRIALMVAGARGETPSPALINRIADQMHLPMDKAIDAINLVSAGTSAQFTAVCNAMGLDAGKAQAWIKEHRADTGMVAAQAHLMRRDVKAWSPLLDAYRQATGDGVKR